MDNSVTVSVTIWDGDYTHNLNWVFTEQALAQQSSDRSEAITMLMKHMLDYTTLINNAD